MASADKARAASSWRMASLRRDSRKVRRSVLRLEVGAEVVVLEAAPGGAPDDLLGGERAAGAVHVLAEPVAERQEAPLADVVLQAGQRAPRRREEARRVQVPEGVGGEVAEVARGPVDVRRTPSASRVGRTPSSACMRSFHAAGRSATASWPRPSPSSSSKRSAMWRL